MRIPHTSTRTSYYWLLYPDSLEVTRLTTNSYCHFITESNYFNTPNDEQSFRRVH
jgi:hypothetical protein